MRSLTLTLTLTLTLPHPHTHPHPYKVISRRERTGTHRSLLVALVRGPEPMRRVNACTKPDRKLEQPTTP